MVKNLPTIERSTKIRFGKQAPINQADNTIVLNASSTAINAPTGDSIYMAPLRVTNPASTTVIGYNPTTKELYNTNVLTSDIGSGGGGDITLGTGTTGDYVSTITGGNGITSTGATSGETIAHELSVDTKENGGLVIDESNKLAVNLGASSITGTLAIGNGGTGATTLTSGKIPYIKADNTFGDSKISYNNETEVTSLSSNLTVTGNLLVQGSATFQHSEIHSVSDPIIEVGNANAIDSIDMGIIMTRPTANVLAGYRGDESEYTIAYTLSDPSSTDIVPTNASTDGYITANIWGNVLCGNVTTSGSLTSTAVNVDGITTSNVVLAGGYVNESTAQYFTVTAVVGAFIIDGVTQPVLTLYRGVTYRFDYSDNSNESHPLRISTTAEGVQYNTGYSSFGTRGSAGAYIQFIVPMEAPDTMYYNCQTHASMGNTINVISPSLTSSVSPVSSNVFIGNHVGIGTSSPSYPLDVTGNMNVTGGLRVNDSTGTNGQVLTSSGGGVMSWGSVGTLHGGTGVTTGLEELDASKIISGTLAVGNGGTGATTLDNLITLGTHTTGNYVQSITAGNGITAGAASEGGTPTVAIDAKTDGGLVIESNKLAVNLGASSITGTLAVGDGGTGVTSYTAGQILYADSPSSLSKLNIGSAGQVLTVAAGIPSWAAASGGSSVWSLNGAKAYYNSGNVGIGTSNPNYKLDVSGTGNFTSSVTASSFSGSGSGLTGLSTSQISSGTLAVARGGTGVTSYTAGQILYADGSSSLSKLNIGSTGQVLTVAAGIPSWAAASGGSSVWSLNGAKAYYNSGNVGIGTSNPNYKLDVSGTGNFTSSVTASSFTGSGSGLTGLSTSQISSGTLAVARGGTGVTSYTAGQILYADGSSSLSKLNIGSTGQVLTVAAGIPSWATASSGGGGMTAGTVTVDNNGMNTIEVTGSAYDYMYHESPHNISYSSSDFNTISISQAMTHGQKVVMKLYTNQFSCQANIARGRDLLVTINSTSHTVNYSNFRDHKLSIPYDTDPSTITKFLILEITKEDTDKVTVEAKLSNADFTKTVVIDATFSPDGIDTNNYDCAIHNVAHASSADLSGSTFRLKVGYFGVGHSHDFYFQQNYNPGTTITSNQIEFYYNNSFNSWSQASETNVYTNFDKNVGMTLTYGKYYHIHHEVLQASTDDHPDKILFTVEEMNAASGGGGGGGSYGTGDFSGQANPTSIGPESGIEITSSFSSATNYNYNSSIIIYTYYDFNFINLLHTLPSSLPLEYHVYFRSNGSFGVNSSDFKVQINGIQKTTYNSFGSPNNNNSFQIQSSPSYRYEVILKSRDPTHDEWTAEWREYKF